MKHITLLLVFFAFSFTSFAQASLDRYKKAEAFLKQNKMDEAYQIYKEIKPQMQTKDTLYKHVVWNAVGSATELEKESRMKEDFINSMKYGFEALALIQENKDLYDKKFAEKEFWMTQNIIVSLFGLGQVEEAKKYKPVLYDAYKSKKLPQGMEKKFQFDFFKMNDKNILGFESFAELPANRLSGSLSKVIYYVYSSNADGTNGKLLYRLHVMMVNQFSKGAAYDYMLEKQTEDEEQMVSGSYHRYIYAEDIDYKKLKKDVQEIVRSDLPPNDKRIISRK